MTEKLLEVFVQYGITGVMLAVVGWAYWRKDKALLEEQQSRIEDAKEYHKSLSDMQGKTHEAIFALRTLHAEIKQKDERRELQEQLRQTGAHPPARR